MVERKDGGIDSPGHGEFKIKQVSVEVEEGEEEEVKKGEKEEELSPEVLKAVNEALIETTCMVVGKTVAVITKIPEMAFDENETAQLKELWSPFIPDIPPLALAILGTVVIVGGKVGTYFALRKKQEERKTSGEQEV